MIQNNTSLASGPELEELVPSRYALRVGEIDVLVISGASDVDLAKVDEFLKVVFVGFGPGGFFRGGLIVHGPLPKNVVVLAEEVGGVVVCY